MVESLVEQLQRDAIDPKVRVADLLRKVLLVASKLEVPSVPTWVEKELSGYNRDNMADDLPQYRVLTGRVMALNPVRGWQAVIFEHSEKENGFSQRPVVDGVAMIEALIENTQNDLIAAYPAEVESLLRKSMNTKLPVACHIGRASMAGILDKIRSRVLRWSLELDKAGIRGQGISFTREEKARAHDIVIHGGSVSFGVIGDVGSYADIATGPHARAGSLDLDDVRKLVAEIEKHVPALKLLSGDEHELRRTLTELKTEGEREKAEPAKVRRLLGRVIGFVGGVGETVITTGIKAYVEAWTKSHGV
jgi:AbiTii